MSLRAVNLNLLPVLQALLREQNVSRAAKDIGITQSAASKTLAQLRQLLDDPLLIRVGNRLVLSKRAEIIRGEVDDVLGLVSSMLGQASFNPIESARAFTISCVDAVALSLMVLLDGRIARDAPHIGLQFVDLPLSGSWGHVDFAIVPGAFFDRLAIPDARSTPLFSDELVWIVPRTADPAEGAEEFEGETDAPLFIQVDHAGGTIIDLDAAQPYRPQWGGASRYSVQQFSMLPYLSMILGAPTQVPRRLFDLLAPFLPIKQLDRRATGDPMAFVLAWRAPQDRDPAHRWLRHWITEALGSQSDAPLPLAATTGS